MVELHCLCCISEECGDAQWMEVKKNSLFCDHSAMYFDKNVEVVVSCLLEDFDTLYMHNVLLN